jgi:hypothetical protein
MMQSYPVRHIQSVTTAFSGRWTYWYALGLYAFLLIYGLVEVRVGSHVGDLYLGVGAVGLLALVIGGLCLRALRTLPVAPFDPSAPSWVREWPMTPAVRDLARRRLAQQLAYVFLSLVAMGILSIVTNGLPHGSKDIIASVTVAVVVLGVVIAMRSTYSDTGSTAYWEAAGPLRGEPVWQMTRVGYALFVGHERLIIPPKVARLIAGQSWGAMLAMRRTAEVIEVRDWFGNVIYRARGYRP